MTTIYTQSLYYYTFGELGQIYIYVMYCSKYY